MNERKIKKYDLKASLFEKKKEKEYLESSVLKKGGLTTPTEEAFKDISKKSEIPSHKEGEFRIKSSSGPKGKRIRSNLDDEDTEAPLILVKDREQLERAEKTSSPNNDEPNDDSILPEFVKDDARLKWEENQLQADREWYHLDEPGSSSMNDFYEYSTSSASAPVSFQRFKVHETPQQSQYARDSNLWETNRMFISGISKKQAMNEEIEQDEESCVNIVVRDKKPKFLEGKAVPKKQEMNIMTVRDPTSDMAVFARRGSRLIMERREQNERINAAKNLDVSQTTLGSLMGLNKADPEEEKASYKDPKDEYKYAKHLENPKSSSTFTSKKTVAQQREMLPIFSVREELLRVIRENQIVIAGETGSGKTTQLAQYLYEDGYTNYGKIACTQPRRVAAMSVAKRSKLGGKVGYSIRFENCTSDETVINYMTDGILLRVSLNSLNMDQYSVIIIDEAHERSLYTEILIGLLKRTISLRRDMKLIVTSATMNTEKFATFLGGVPVFNIPGRTFPIEIYFSKTPCEYYVEAAIKKTLEIHLSQPPGDILVFMTGQEDVEITCAIIKERLAQLEDVVKLAVLPIYSQLPADLQAKIFQETEDNSRKVIVATNVAETSLTVDGISYVVDTGFTKLKVYNPKIGMEILQVTPISQESAKQRAGRAGRTGPGTCYRLYTESAYFRELFVHSIPEIQRTNLTNVVLLLKIMGIDDPLNFDFIDPPTKGSIYSSTYQLWILGAIDDDGKLTKLGRRMAEYPCDPALAKMMLHSEYFGCTSEIVTIVSMLSVPSIFYRPKTREEESDAVREKFFVTESDHLTLLHIYKQWEANRCRDSWCNAHFINPKSMRRAREVKSQLIGIMKSHGKKVISSGSNWDIIRRCICSAYFYQAAKINGIGEYINLRSGIPCKLHPTNALYSRGYTPDYIVYHELVVTSKEYMRCATAVEPEWLAEYGHMFFSIRDKSGRMRTVPEPKESQKVDSNPDETAKTTQNVEVQSNLHKEKKRSNLFQKRKFGI